MSDPSLAKNVLVVEGRPELAQLMAAALETAGFSISVAESAREGRRRIAEEPPDGLVLELLLPDAFGFEVARSLREARPEAAVIAVSEAFDADPAVREALASGLFDTFLRKPFRIGRIIDELQMRLGLFRDEGTGACQAEVGDPARDLAAGAVEGTPFDFSFDDPEEGLVTAALKAAEAACTEGSKAQGEEGSEPAAGGELIGEASSSAHRPDASTRLDTGDLSERSVPRLINAFYLSGQSGELSLRRGRVVKMVYFRDGLPAFAASNLREDRLDVRLLERGEVDADTVKEAVEEAGRVGRRIDRVLLERGVLRPARHKALVTEQVKSILFSLFSWREGVWQITFDDRAEQEPVRLEVHPTDLIFEGAAGLSLETLVELLPRDVRLVPSPSPPYELYQLSLSGPQAMIVSRLDGTRSVEEIAEEGWLPEQETHALLYALLCLEVVEDASLLLL